MPETGAAQFRPDVDVLNVDAVVALPRREVQVPDRGASEAFWVVWIDDDVCPYMCLLIVWKQRMPQHVGC